LGRFTLHRAVGRGGMGEVWAASAEGFRQPLAVKVLTHRTQDDAFVRAFRNEVRAAASLDHPHVVRVFDYGEVAEGEARSPSFAAGAPYLVMERVGGGTLSTVTGQLDWPELRAALHQLLQALAHAHARGVIHRDLKPANVLVRQTDGDLWVQLTDFGLAHAAGGGPDEALGGGTPSYMAPEQFVGTWREVGPWTDLYALGCLGWALAHGAPPWGAARTVDEKRRQHLREALPRLEPVVAVPVGFEAWLRRLLQKAPEDRFRSAADAAWALAQLGEPEPSLVVSGASTVGPEGSLASLGTLDEITVELEPEVSRVGDPAAATVRRPPFPRRWRPLELPRDYEAAGAGLFGLRAVPLVGRERERDQLWAALGATIEAGRAQIAVLSGAAGCGKSRLARWLCERAVELGVAQVFRAAHGPVEGPGLGLPAMLSEALKCQDLTREELAWRIEGVLRGQGVRHADEWRALAEVVSPSAGAAGGVQFQTATERYIPIRRFLQRATADRPVILWLDDAHWARDGLGLVRHVVDATALHPMPVLVVLTVTAEALAERPVERAWLAELTRLPCAETVAVGPLPAAHHAALVRNLLGLAPELARSVEARTAGNPSFAVQLVGDWVQRGLVVAGPDGYRVPPGAELALPEDVRSVWGGRVERLCARRRSGQVVALELAALLGADVDGGEWAAACARAGGDASPGLVDELLDQRLAVPSMDGAGAGWRFAHAMLREALEDQSIRAGRAPALHRACADALSARGAPLPHERLARHWVGSGLPDAAVAPLREAAEVRMGQGDFVQASALLDQREGWLATSPPGDPRWGEGWLLRHEVARRRGEGAAAAQWLDRADQGARTHGWGEVGVRVAIARSRAARWQGDARQARQLAGAAELRARELGGPRWVAEARLETALVGKALGQLEEAAEAVARALTEFDRVGDPVGSARCVQVQGQICKQMGRHREASALLAQAEERFERAGHRLGMAQAANSRADVLRFGGDLAGAAALYRRARGLFRTVGSWEACYPDLNLALLAVAQGRGAEAESDIEALMPVFQQVGNPAVLAVLHVALAACSAGAGRWLSWDDHLREAAEQLSDSALADEDLARVAAVAADHAEAHGETGRAVDALLIAADQWRRLGRTPEQRQVAERIRSLGA
jgi:tetratricopeptide (TPR) repeat protein